MANPKVDIEKETLDWILETIAMLLLVGLVVLPALYYSDLPDSIPGHFNGAGKVDDYSQKMILWTLPAIGVVLFVGLTILNHFPHIFNYPIKITDTNAESQYLQATRLIRFLKAIISGSFLYVYYQSIQTALGISTGLGAYFLPGFLALIFGALVIYLYSAIKKK